MESQGTIGGLIPLWILGAPFLLALFELFTIPKPSGRRGHEGDSPVRAYPSVDTASSSRPQAPGRP